MLKTPVALIIFNRPETTALVFKEIAKAQPKRLFIIADGPRPDHVDDSERCAAARAVTERVDWDCEVKRLYSDSNLGCGFGPANGISWLFDQVDEAIILEDDCVPLQSFFRFSEELLSKYRDDTRVMMISGRYSQYNAESWSDLFRDSYSFTHTHNCWGWATWKRAWQHFDLHIQDWPRLRKTSWLMDLFEDAGAAERWQKTFDRVLAEKNNIHAWDYQWSFAIWSKNGLAIKPKVHLISNIGFGDSATHTKAIRTDRGGRTEAEMDFPLVHPTTVTRNVELDRLVSAIHAKNHPQKLGWHARLKRRLALAVSRVKTVLSPR